MFSTPLPTRHAPLVTPTATLSVASMVALVSLPSTARAAGVAARKSLKGSIARRGASSAAALSLLTALVGSIASPASAGVGLSCSPTYSPPTVTVGDTITFTLVATNYGPHPGINVRVADFLPAGVAYVSDDGGGAYNPSTGVWTIGTLAAGLATTRRAPAASDQLNVALIGVRGRGRALAGVFAKLPDANIQYLVDVDDRVIPAASAVIEKAGKKAPQVVRDLRRVLDDKSIDAVVIATPDHWHAPAAILACDAGKDVYLEKPCSHNIREGRLMEFSDRFHDLWRYYLMYCEGGFRGGGIDVAQVTMVKG